MAELLDRIHAEIRERLAASRGAMEEYERLQAALTALEGPTPAARPRAPRRANREVVLRPAEAAPEREEPRTEPAAAPEPVVEAPEASPPPVAIPVPEPAPE